MLPDRLYTKTEFIAALSIIRKKAQNLILPASEDQLSRRWINENEIELHGLCPSLVVNYGLLEILLYNLRHVQHHIGQLNWILRQEADVAAEWIALTIS